MPTPQSRDHKGRPASGFNRSNLPQAVALMPTPTCENGRSRGGKRRGELLLGGIAAALLPTPRAAWPGDGETPQQWQARNSALAARRSKGRSGLPLATAIQLLAGAGTDPPSAAGNT
jgi:hypothetical protein